MRPSLYMQESVDKEIQDECALAHAVVRSLLLRLGEADDDFAVRRVNRVGEDIWDILLVA